MKSEENLVISCQREVDRIVNSGKVELSYSPVYNPQKNRYIGYISEPTFSNLFVTLEKVKHAATQLDKVNELMYNIYKKQLVSFIKKRPNKQSKLLIFARLEDLSSFIEVYFSESSFQDCKIILSLDVKKGYEMINKFSNISNNLNRLLNEGVELACLINQSNMYDYDYILRISNYLILDSSVVTVSKNNLIENKLLNMIELAKSYDLDLFAIDVDEYLEFECLLKYKVEYISGEYFGLNTSSPTEIEYTRTRLLSKIIKDSTKSKK
jgi:EAL domain-containing protein (putative c-di-GMP-specific phosphodiesterase class I)